MRTFIILTECRSNGSRGTFEYTANSSAEAFKAAQAQLGPYDLIEVRGLPDCEKCGNSGIWIAHELDQSAVIERCDHCSQYATDAEAIAAVEKLVYRGGK